jgi:hypothetical protein
MIGFPTSLDRTRSENGGSVGADHIVKRVYASQLMIRPPVAEIPSLPNWNIPCGGQGGSQVPFPIFWSYLTRPYIQHLSLIEELKMWVILISKEAV